MIATAKKAHIGVDADSGPVHTVRGTSGSVGDVAEANALLHGEETQAWGDAGCRAASKRPDATSSARWNIAMPPGKRRRLDKTRWVDRLTDQLEQLQGQRARRSSTRSESSSGNGAT